MQKDALVRKFADSIGHYTQGAYNSNRDNKWCCDTCHKDYTITYRSRHIKDIHSTELEKFMKNQTQPVNLTPVENHPASFTLNWSSLSDATYRSEDVNDKEPVFSSTVPLSKSITRLAKEQQDQVTAPLNLEVVRPEEDANPPMAEMEVEKDVANVLVELMDTKEPEAPANLDYSLLSRHSIFQSQPPTLDNTSRVLPTYADKNTDDQIMDIDVKSNEIDTGSKAFMGSNLRGCR